MNRCPKTSFDDLGFFFDDFHGQVAQTAAEFAGRWQFDDNRDDREATRDAVTQLTQAGLTAFVFPNALVGPPLAAQMV